MRAVQDGPGRVEILTTKNPRRDISISVTSVSFFITGLLGLGILWAVVYFVVYGTSPVIFGGIRSMPEGGPFEALGPTAMTVLGFLFVFLSGLGFVAGYWLWQSRARGGKLGLVLAAAGIVFAIGFLVPLWLILHPLQLVLIMTARKNLREG